MKLLIEQGRVIDPASGRDEVADIAIAAGRIVAIGKAPGSFTPDRRLNAAGCIVAPGLIDTEIVDERVPVDEILKAVPAARMGQPEEVAHAVRFLMDEKAAYITRQVIAVNGGLC